jgi:hypothetical protein
MPTAWSPQNNDRVRAIAASRACLSCSKDLDILSLPGVKTRERNLRKKAGIVEAVMDDLIHCQAALGHYHMALFQTP